VDLLRCSSRIQKKEHSKNVTGENMADDKRGQTSQRCRRSDRDCRRRLRGRITDSTKKRRRHRRSRWAAVGGLIGNAKGHPGAGAAIGSAVGLGAGALIGNYFHTAGKDHLPIAYATDPAKA
jgi:Glycine zipper